MHTPGDSQPDSMEGYPFYETICVSYNSQTKTESQTLSDSSSTTSTITLDAASRELCTDHRNSYNVPAFLDANYPLETGQVVTDDFGGNAR